MLSITRLEELPSCSGIYRVLDQNGTVIYIGQAKDIHERWNRGHHKLIEIIAYCQGVDAFIDWTYVPQWLLNRVENCAVRHYNPILNKKKPPVL